MENIKKCPVCKSTNNTLLFKARDFSGSTDNVFAYAQCKNCSLIFLSKRPTENNIGKYYSKTYTPFLGTYNFLVKKFIKFRTLKEIKLFKQINNEIENVLEIGSSYGEYLNNLKKFGGYNVIGVETDKASCEEGKKRYGIDIKNNSLDKEHFPDNSFDLIVMNHVIEHLYNYSGTISEIKRIIKKNGLFLIKTPNFETVERNIFRKYWCPFEAPRHTMLFSEKILRDELKKYGFKIIKIKYEKTPNNIILSIKNYLIDKNYPKSIINFFNINNYLLLVLFLPFSIIIGSFKSGRIVVIAQKK